MADPEQHDFDEFDTLVDDTLEPEDDLSFDQPDNTGRKKKQAAFYVVLLGFILLVGASVWFVFLRQPEVQITPVTTAEQDNTGGLPPGVLSPEELAANEVPQDGATGTAQDGSEISIVPVDPNAVTPEVPTPQVVSPDVTPVANAETPAATITNTGTTVEALPPPIDADPAAIQAPPAIATEETPGDSSADNSAVVPSAPEGLSPPPVDAPAAQPVAEEPIVMAPAQDIAPAETPAPVAAPVTAQPDPALLQRLEKLESQLRDVASAPAPVASGTDNAASEQLAGQLKALTAKLDALTNQVESLDQRTTTFAAELQNRSNEAARPAPAAKPAPKAAPKPAAPVARKAPAYKPPATPTWELRSAQPGAAWLGKPGSNDLNRFAIGQNVPGLGVVQDVSQVNGRWVVRTTGGTLRQ